MLKKFGKVLSKASVAFKRHEPFATSVINLTAALIMLFKALQ